MQNKVVGVFKHNFRDSFEIIHSLSFYLLFTFHHIHSFFNFQDMQPMIQIPQVFTVFDVEEKLDLGS